MTQLMLRYPFTGVFEMTEGFGERPAYYREKYGFSGHEGINWRVPLGTPVLATDGGTVSRIFTNVNAPREEYPYGLYVYMVHSWGESVYANLSSVAVNLNQVVEAGTVLGASGDTGNTTEPTLHFGIRFPGYDPKDGFRGYASPHRHLPMYNEEALEVRPILRPITDHPEGEVLCRIDTHGQPLFLVCIYDKELERWMEVATGSFANPTGWIPLPTHA